MGGARRRSESRGSEVLKVRLFGGRVTAGGAAAVRVRPVPGPSESSARANCAHGEYSRVPRQHTGTQTGLLGPGGDGGWGRLQATVGFHGRRERRRGEPSLDTRRAASSHTSPHHFDCHLPVSGLQFRSSNS
jgi:hypothetical protein